MMKWFGKWRRRSRRDWKKPRGYLPSTLLASLNLLGPVGSFFAGAVGSFWTKRRIENIEHVVGVMGEKLQAVDASEIREYMCSEEYIQLFLSTVQRAQVEHQEEKRRAYGVMLANMAVDTETKYDQKSMFISVLSEIELLHVETLSYLEVKVERGDDEEGWASFDEVRSAVADLSQNSSYVAIAVLQKLAGCGFVKSRGKNDTAIMTGVNPVGLWFHSLYRVTDLGERFLEFLKA